MNYTIILSKQFTKDVEATVEYITFTLNNISAAEGISILINSKINNLQYFPKKYPIIDDISLLQQQIHYIPVDNYLIFYTIGEAKRQIQILRFLYAKSNWLAILKRNKHTSAYPKNFFEDKHYINEEKSKY